MKTSDFDYDLPEGRIAQTPIEPRHASRLLVLWRETGKIEHTTFERIGDYLIPGDLLVINRTRVIPARLLARKPTGGKVEILLLNKQSPDTWEALVGGKGMISGKIVQVEGGPEAVIVDSLEGSRRLVKFSEPIEGYLEKIGKMPLPPYIHIPLANPERYQTVYSQRAGSAAAPTAGLHFTHTLMKRLEDQGVRFASVLLHVGLDTFAPVTEDDPRTHQIHSEWCEVEEEAAAAINAAKRKGRRVVAIGTTTVRTLESAASRAAPGEWIGPFSGPTNLYILPGYNFKVVDSMVTNFHLPKSTLLMLVSAFAGRERILETYKLAVEEQYRFYSFGDAMLIL
ncbi:MAG TPA: tRNA preQ1(34) S-adenosylmethionine ribosyltransferase-isomerase QueA [Anaerolineaceae bacterium]